MPKYSRVALLGAGNRGSRVYSDYILRHQDRLRLVAVAEPDRVRRQGVARKHGLASGDVFSSWEGLLSTRNDFDGVIVATMDQDHLEPTLSALESGKIVLLEKPMASNPDDLLQLYQASRGTPRSLLVAHVLRYTRFFQRIKKLLEEGVVGRPRLIQHNEEIGYYHFAHSFVRGNWRREETSCPIILAKCCHDLDLFHWWMSSKCRRLASRGALNFFHPGQKPQGAGERCLECSVEENCEFSAKKIYLSAGMEWPTTAISENLSWGGIKRALEKGPYGRCVFFCDNDVPDTQTVELEYEDETIIQFALTAFSARINRTTRIFATQGEIRGDFFSGKIEIEPFGKPKKVLELGPDTGDHGGGDDGLMDNFNRLLLGKELDVSTGVEASLESHLQAFAAEKSRKGKEPIEMKNFRGNWLKNK